MLKRILSMVTATLVLFNMASAQDFQFTFDNPVHDTTGGTEVFSSESFGHDNYGLRNFVKNISDDTFAIDWKYIDRDNTVDTSNEFTITDAWFVTGICDNINCRAEFGEWYWGAIETSAPFGPGEQMLIEIDIYAPKTSKDTTRTFKVELKSPNQTDTAIFVLTKVQGLGVSVFAVNDKKVSVFPNPLTPGAKLNVFVNESLNAKTIEVYNVIGQKQLSVPVNKETESIDVNRLAKGLYIVKVADEQGRILASRKFSKQ